MRPVPAVRLSLSLLSREQETPPAFLAMALSKQPSPVLIKYSADEVTEHQMRKLGVHFLSRERTGQDGRGHKLNSERERERVNVPPIFFGKEKVRFVFQFYFIVSPDDSEIQSWKGPLRVFNAFLIRQMGALGRSLTSKAF